ncbi:hypothetical protein WJX72_007279 [[Myrmecia] bisecta]|uniref:Uncharacterized protein n=1 Tax=[Myrmecia] bisecta TaxID=41462 RepID=A0AAW1Q7F9_9CHLO
MSMVVGGRQKGKTTLAQEVLLSLEGECITKNKRDVSLVGIRVCLTAETPLEPNRFLRWLHTIWHAQHPDDIRHPEMPLEEARFDLLKALRWTEESCCAWVLMVDDAAFLSAHHLKSAPEQQLARKTAWEFMNMIKDDFRDSKPLYTVHSVILLGVDRLRRVVHDVNQWTHKCSDSGAAGSPDAQRSGSSSVACIVQQAASY